MIKNQILFKELWETYSRFHIYFRRFKIISKLVFSKKLKHEIFNVCSNKPKRLTDIIKKINFLTLKKPKILKRKLQLADVLKLMVPIKKL